jgi:diamine N-acetyltransferase
MIEIVDASIEDLSTIQEMAERTWWPTYGKILTPVQIRFMLDNIYNTGTLRTAMEDGSQQFILLKNETVCQAFASYGQRKENPVVYKLHKIYVLPENHGKGYGALMIQEIKKRLLAQNIRILDLNVNRYNAARNFYEKIGFEVIREEDVPIGPYWMNDFVMRLNF